MLKSTLMPTVMLGVPLLKIAGRARVKYLFDASRLKVVKRLQGLPKMLLVSSRSP
jgi:hypothetical protein